MQERNREDYRVRWLTSIHEVNRLAWNTLAGEIEFPFLEWDWLAWLEASGSASVETGWTPSHLTVWSGEELVAAAPMYLKWHSDGEFIFDQVWLELAYRMGLAYYPKLVGMCPFTPAAGYRFLISSSYSHRKLTETMIRAIEAFCRENGVPGCHFQHVDPQWAELLRRFGFISWLHQNFVWENHAYQSFEDYLSRLKSNARRNIKREMNSLGQAGIVVKPFTGQDIPRSLMSRMYAFYSRTNEQYGPWGCHYLNRSFFESVFNDFRHRLLLMAAFREGDDSDPVGMSLLVFKGKRLFGRYWGCREQIRHLHFQVCYYSPIQWAIENGLQSFEPGIGGAHKLYRGFTLTPGLSLHRFFNAQMHWVMNSYAEQINSLTLDQLERLNAKSPLKPPIG
jgi:hypothetical protein